MIKMVAGVFGLPIGNGIVERKTKDSEPFNASAEQEARLVKLGLARYVDAPVPAEPIGFDETPDEDAKLPELPDGVVGIPEYSVDMKAAELREIGALCGLTFKVGMTKAEMVAALDKHIEENTVVDETPDEDAPTFDAAEAVL